MDWVFDGGRYCLDLVNTLRNRYRHPDSVELLRVPADLARWLTAAGLPSGRGTRAHLAAARELREAIDRVLLAASHQRQPRRADVLLLNDTARLVPPPVPRLALRPDGVALRWPRPADPIAAALAAMAVDAIELATDTPAVRVCASEGCGLRFLDVSPKRNRQWCSMARCGNRAKARAHYARRLDSPAP